MAKKKGLGKGLDSMIPKMPKPNEEKKAGNVSRETLIDINKIEPNREQPRKSFDEESLHELADSIRQMGIIQPIILQKEKDYYKIIAGERRWRAARIAKLEKVPAIIKEYEKQEILEIALIENIQREDLNPIEEAIAYEKLINEFNITQSELAKRVSKSRVAITNTMRLLKLDEVVKTMIIEGNITSGHGRTLLRLEDNKEQQEIAKIIIDEELSVRETEELIKKLILKKEKKEESKISTNNIEDDFIYRDMEEKIKSILGTKVMIYKKKKDKGKIEIEYYSDEELERILDLFESLR